MPATAPQTIAEVVARMRAIERSCAPGDGVAAFTRLYLTVTEGVRDAVRRATFKDPRFLARLDVVFANLFFAAVIGRPCHAWQPLFEARGRKGIAPIQFAL